MAALSHTAAPYITELRTLRSSHLEELLAEEIAAWREDFQWDFRPSADLVRRFVDQQALSGFALLSSATGRTRVIGYVYTVQDDGKGLIGDLYVARAERTQAAEHQLLSSAVHMLMETPFLRRVETQLMMLGPGDPQRPLPEREHLRRFDRLFLRLDFATAPPSDPRPTSPRVAVERWTGWHQEAAARLIASSYTGHIDGEINDQYRTPDGARRFLYNVVQYPGCGAFRRHGSYAAVDRDTGAMCGMVLASQVAPEIGHITQICVEPRWRGHGIGRDLLQHSLQAMSDSGCAGVSLTVTAANRRAIDLYEQVGFRVSHQFQAYVWEGF